jgi:hypothetical protein
MTVERRERIRALNDQLRRFHTGGRIMITKGVVAEGEAFLTNALLLIAAFDDFSEANDPYGERDFGALTVSGERLFWKIDYYDPSLTCAAVDPAQSDGCVRVLTVMKAEEY